MAVDAAPALLEELQRQFRRRTAQDKTLSRILGRVEQGKAELVEVHDYAQHLGEALSFSLLAVLTEDNLPDGKLYWNVANRTIRPMLEQNYRLTNEAAGAVQRSIDEAAGIGLAAVDGEFPEERIRGIVDKAASAETPEALRDWFGEPIVNCSESFFDGFVQANADFRQSAGMAPKIVRTVVGSCCDWCAELAGTYDYADVRHGSDVFRRHKYCRCTVTFVSGGKRQNVWTKQSWQEAPETLKAQKTVGLEQGRGQDVTPAYFGTATPGEGKIEYAPGYKQRHHTEEIQTAQWIHDTFGGDLSLLTEAKEMDRKTPDFEWRSRLWELKTTSSLNAVDQAVRGALKQIANNPGGIIIDARQANLSEQALRRTVCHRLDRSAISTLDVIIRLTNGETVIIRHKK